MRRRGVGRGPGPGRMAARMAVRRMARRMVRRRRRRRRRRVILVGGMVAFGAYKLSKKDVERVEEQTGKTAEDLTDEEMEAALDDLGIDAEEMTDEEYAQVEAADAEPDPYEELERLGKLRDSGILTDEEFEVQKKKILSQM